MYITVATTFNPVLLWFKRGNVLYKHHRQHYIRYYWYLPWQSRDNVRDVHCLHNMYHVDCYVHTHVMQCTINYKSVLSPRKPSEAAAPTDSATNETDEPMEQ